MYVCCKFIAMAGWCASLSRRVFSVSASSFHCGAAISGVGFEVRCFVNCSRVLVLGSTVAVKSRDKAMLRW